METRKVTCVSSTTKPSNIKPKIKNWTDLRAFKPEMDVKEDSNYYEFSFTEDAPCTKEQLLNLTKYIWSHSDANRLKREAQCYPTDSHIINIMWEDIAKIKEQLASTEDMPTSQANVCDKLLEHYPPGTNVFKDIEYKNGLVLDILNKNDDDCVNGFIKSLDSNDNVKSLMRNVNINKIVQKIKPFISSHTNPYLVKIIQLIDGEIELDKVDSILFNQLSTYVTNDYAKQIHNHEGAIDTLNTYDEEYKADEFVLNNHRSIQPVTIYTYRNVDSQVLCLGMSLLFILYVFVRTVITTSRGEPFFKHWLLDSLVGIRVVSTAMATRIMPEANSQMYIKKYKGKNPLGFIYRTFVSMALLSYNKQVKLQTKTINGLIMEHELYYEFQVKKMNVSGWICYGISQILSLVGLTGNIIFTRDDVSQTYVPNTKNAYVL